MPFKVFTNGVPLPASDLNDYLMEQSIATFADSAARAAQLVSPTEGQVTYLADTNTVEIFDGSNWVNFGASENLISTTTLTGASVVLSSLPQTYSSLKLVIRNFRPSADALLYMRWNGLATAIYGNGNTSIVSGSGDTQIELIINNQDNGASNSGLIIANIFDYTNSTTWKFGNRQSATNDGTTATTTRLSSGTYGAQITSALTSITLLPSTGTFTSGTVLLYGVK